MKPFAQSDRLDRLTETDLDRIDLLVDGWDSGILSDDTFLERFRQVLESGHAEAATLGRHLSGDTSPLGPSDQSFAGAVMGEQAPYIEGLRHDMSGDDFPAERLRARARSYLDRYVGTANEVWTLLSPPGLSFDWILAPDAAHCEDCPSLAAGSPYTAATLPTVPGKNDTACLFSCRCLLLRSDGQGGFGG